MAAKVAIAPLLLLVLSVGFSQDPPTPGGTATQDNATVVVVVSPKSASIELAGVSVVGETTSIELTSGEPTEVGPGAYVLNVSGTEIAPADAVVRPVHLQPAREYSFTFDLPTIEPPASTPTIDWFVLLIMAVVVIALSGGMILYFRNIQLTYYELVASMVGRVRRVKPVITNTLVALGPAQVNTMRAKATNGAGPSPLDVDYPQMVPVGSESQPFRIKTSLGQQAATTWSVVQPDLATIRPSADGLEATVFAAKPGVIDVDISAQDGSSTFYARASVTATEMTSESFELPWVGQGIGGYVIAVLVIGVAMVLAFAGLYDATAIATLLVAIAGYAFGHVRATK